MENETSPGAGWWQASDGNWYRPESHPDYVPQAGPPTAASPPAASLPAAALPAAALPAPSAPRPQFAPAAASESPTGHHAASVDRPSAHAAHGTPQPWWKQSWFAVLAVALALAGVVLMVGARGGSPDGTATTQDSTTADREERTAAVPEPTSAASVNSVLEDEQANAANSGTAPGDRGNPFGFDAPVPVTVMAFGDADGSVWNITVQAPRDMTAEVLDTNDYNEPPPDGVIFVGFDAQITLASANSQPLSSIFSLEWAFAGGDSNALYDARTLEGLFGCGQIRNEFNIFAEVFVGGTIAGTVCIPMPVEDANHPQTQPVLLLSNSLVAFGSGGVTPVPASIDAPRQTATEDENAFDAISPVVAANFADEESVWNVQLSAPRDITDQVVAASDFNESPPDGVLYVGFDAEVTLATGDIEPVAVGLNHSWEILGGATAGVYDHSAIGGLFGCGSFDGDFDDFAEVFRGGTVQGVVCLPVPAEDLGHPDTKIAMNFNGNRLVFSADGQSQGPVEINPGPGPAGMANTRPLSESVELRWDVFGDADGSVWATVVRPRRDITAAVLAESDFNDPPPEGVVYAGFEVELTLVEGQTEPLSTSSSVSWEILGGATRRVYGGNTLVQSFGCGSVPGEFDSFAEVFPGGTLRGTVCVPVPIEDFDHPDTRVALVIGEDRIPFGPR